MFDDLPLIQDSPQIRSADQVAKIFGRQGYRPVRTLTYALNYWLFGPHPFYFHLTNVLLHAANGVLVFLLLQTLFSPGAALAGAALFICHPAQTAAVAYVSGRKDVLAAGFLVAGLLCFASFRNTRKRHALLGAVGLFALALFSKEVAVIFPALLFAWDFLDGHWERQDWGRTGLARRAGEVLRGHRWFYGSLLAAALIFLYYAQFVMYASRKATFWGGSALNNYLTSLKLFSHYLRLALVPYPLIADYEGVFPVAGGIGDAGAWVGAAVMGGYLWLLVWTSRRQPRIAFGLLWFLVTLLPVIQLLPFHEIAADHYLYLPLVGIIIALLGLARWQRERVSARVLAWTAALVVVLFSVATVARNRDWRDTISLWEATVRRVPGSARVQNNLGTAFHAAGNVARALPHLKRATELDPSTAAYWSNLGAAYHDRGDYESAIRTLLRAAAIRPEDPFTQSNLGNAYKKLAMSRGDRNPDSPLWRDALAHLRRAVALMENNGALHYNLGSAHFELGERTQARRCFETACRVNPDFEPAHYALALMDSQDGHTAAAARRLQRLLSVKPHNLEAIQLLAAVLRRQGDYRQAKALLEDAVARFPASSGLRLELGLLYKSLGEAGKARQQLGLALQLGPGSDQAAEIRRALDSL
ncbi:MAG: tetratricopeptide repeat protein [Acidobacteria bacterium]|nr:tetratricopeptide repeat protein [Acidobacteriota bacterium]